MELDALNMCPDVGDACGLSAAQVCHGLMRMWAWVFRSEVAVLSGIQVAGFMYGNERAIEALVAFGFLALGGDKYRVRGASRLLGARDSRRKGGLAASGNLIPGAYHRAKKATSTEGAAHGPADGPAEHPADGQPNNSIGCPSALTPTTHYQLPTTQKRESSAPSPAQSATAWPETGESSFLDRRSRPRDTAPPPAPAVLEVYGHYREVFGRRHVEPSSAERDVIAARLAEDFSPDELCKAVSGLAQSEFHRRKGLVALRYALGDRDTVERCIQWADAPPDEVTTGPPRCDPNQGILRGPS